MQLRFVFCEKVYHAAVDPIKFGGHRIARAEKIEWADDGNPIFPRPHGYFSPIPLPSGQVVSNDASTFTNPIISGNSADPSAIFLNGYYYLSLSTKGESQLTIFKSSRLTDFRNTESKVILGPQECMFDIWASELHLIHDELYIYFTYRSCDNPPGKDHYMYVMKAEDPNNPLGNWSNPIRLLPEVRTSIIQSTFKYKNIRVCSMYYMVQKQRYILYLYRHMCRILFAVGRRLDNRRHNPETRIRRKLVFCFCHKC